MVRCTLVTALPAAPPPAPAPPAPPAPPPAPPAPPPAPPVAPPPPPPVVPPPPPPPSGGGGHSAVTAIGVDSDVKGSEPPVEASATIVWGPSPRNSAGIVNDQLSPSSSANPAELPSTNISKLLKVLLSNVPLTVSGSSHSVVVPSAGSSITGGQSKVIVKVTASDSEDSSPSITAVATMVCSPLPKTVGSIVIDHVESPSPGVMVVVLPMRVSPSYRFTVVVAGSVVPLIVKSSHSVPSFSTRRSTDLGQSKVIVKVTASDSEDSSPSITAVATMVCSPLPKT